MARCADCNKFVSYDDSGEPEVDVEVDEVAITGTVRIALMCAECGTELRESTFDIDENIEGIFEHCTGEGHNLDVSCDSCDLTTHQDTVNAKGKPIPFRSRKTFYGYSVAFTVICQCGKKESYDFADSVQASHMDEI
jgi:hypothetical protein